MPKEKFNTLTSWSYSVYTKWLQCPFSVCLEKIKKVRITEPQSDTLDYGNAAHGIAQQFVAGKGSLTQAAVVAEQARAKSREGPIETTHFKEAMKAVKPHAALLERLRKAKAQVELQWAFTREYQPTSWYGGDAWLRVIIDALRDQKKPPEVEITDYKTGKVYEDHKLQRKLYAMTGLRLVQIGQLAGGSKAVKLTTSHVYLNGTQTGTETFGMKDLAPLQKEWEARIKPMMTDTEFPTRVGYHCRWCKFRKSAGGPCPENQ